MSDLDNLASTFDGLSAALVRLNAVAADVYDASRTPATIDPDVVADVLALAWDVQVVANAIYHHLRHVATVKAEANAPAYTLVSPSGEVGWKAVNVHGKWAPMALHRMTATELEEVRP